MKSRHISTFDFLQALQQEYICLDIRSKIYISKEDRSYFKTLLDKKKGNIQTLAERNDLATIFNDQREYRKQWNRVVPEYGLPNFIYNIANVSEKQLKFPYKGTVVEILSEGRYGITERFNFSDDTVTVMIDGTLHRYGASDVRRLTHNETDEYFYYYPNNHFKAEIRGVELVGLLQNYDMKKKQAILNFDGDCITLQAEEIRRVL